MKETSCPSLQRGNCAPDEEPRRTLRRCGSHPNWCRRRYRRPGTTAQRLKRPNQVDVMTAKARAKMSRAYPEPASLRGRDSTSTPVLGISGLARRQGSSQLNVRCSILYRQQRPSDLSLANAARPRPSRSGRTPGPPADSLRHRVRLFCLGTDLIADQVKP